MQAVSEEGLRWGDRAEELPTIERLHMCVDVPHDLGDGEAAGEFGISCVPSLLKIRGLKELKFWLLPSAAFKRLVEERTHGDKIEGLPGRFGTIKWTAGMSVACLELKPKPI
mmetsp:Transcript_30820/g.89641  ORF Transcript_30820/g.89641 Transcript_30820/m.89641 type:complete len:112 (-) Transcript_30820:430-765(-)